jgi:hypothetical protein
MAHFHPTQRAAPHIRSYQLKRNIVAIQVGHEAKWAFGYVHIWNNWTYMQVAPCALTGLTTPTCSSAYFVCMHGQAYSYVASSFRIFPLISLIYIIELINRRVESAN